MAKLYPQLKLLGVFDAFTHYSPVVQLIFILKHPKGLHRLHELLGVYVVNFPGKCHADGGGDAIVFLRLLLSTKRTDTGPVEGEQTCNIRELLNIERPIHKTVTQGFCCPIFPTKKTQSWIFFKLFANEKKLLLATTNPGKILVGARFLGTPAGN